MKEQVKITCKTNPALTLETFHSGRFVFRQSIEGKSEVIAPILKPQDLISIYSSLLSQSWVRAQYPALYMPISQVTGDVVETKSATVDSILESKDLSGIMSKARTQDHAGLMVAMSVHFADRQINPWSMANPITDLYDGGSVVIGIAASRLALSYDKKKKLVYFSRNHLLVDLMLHLGWHMLRDALTLRYDSRYYMPGLPVHRSNSWDRVCRKEMPVI